MINVEIIKSGADNSMHVIRKFSRRVQSSGLIQAVRGKRYFERPFSKAMKKKQALRRIARREERTQLIKEGKLSETPDRQGRRPSAPTIPSASASASTTSSATESPASEASGANS